MTLSARAKSALAGEIVLTYCRMRWAMWRHEVPEIVAAIRSGGVASGTLAAPRREQLAGAVMGVLACLPTDSRCLVRSLVYLALLSRRGVEGKLVIGVRTAPDFAAHAWVELDGVALLPPGDGFAPLATI